MTTPAENDRTIYAQLDAAAREVGRLHEMLLARMRAQDPNAPLYAQAVREFVDTELRIHELSRLVFSQLPEK